MKCKGEYNILYTVSYFNPIGNCENIVHIEADSESGKIVKENGEYVFFVII